MPNVYSRLEGLSEGLAVKVACKAASSVNVSLSGEQTIDDIVMVDGDYAFLFGQDDKRENGVWVVSTGAWVRRRDFDGNNDISKGTMVFVTGGTENGNHFYKVTSESPVIGTDDIEFSIVYFDSEVDAAAAEAAKLDAEAAALQAQTFAENAQSILNQVNDSLSGTSTTNVTIGSGSKSFVTQTDLAIGIGSYVQIVSAAAPTSKVMNGQVTAYSSGNMTVNVTYTSGSGNASDWIIRVSGPQGATGATGPAGAGAGDMLKSENLSGLSSYPSARTNLGLADSATSTVVSIRKIEQNSKSADYTLGLSDGGMHILHPSADTTARTITIPENGTTAFPIGTAITLVNQNGAGDLNIAIGGTDVLRIAGSGSTGSRVLADNGVATILKITSTEWIISGIGLS